MGGGGKRERGERPRAQFQFYCLSKASLNNEVRKRVMFTKYLHRSNDVNYKVVMDEVPISPTYMNLGG